MSENLIIAALPEAWQAIKQRIDELAEDTGLPGRDKAKRQRKSIHSDLLAISLGINSRVFRGYLENEEFVSDSTEKYFSDKRVRKRVDSIVKYFWRMKEEAIDARLITPILSSALKTTSDSYARIVGYVGDHYFIHLNRDGGLYFGPLKIVKNDTGTVTFSHSAQHVNAESSAPIELTYEGVVVPFDGGMILLSFGANKAVPYFRMFNAKTVHDIDSLVTYGIYSGKTTSDGVIFSARAALIPKKIWEMQKNNSSFVNLLTAALANASQDNPGAIALSNDLKTLYPNT